MRTEIPSSERSQHWQSPACCQIGSISTSTKARFHLVWTHHQRWSHGWPNIFFCPAWVPLPSWLGVLRTKRTPSQDNNIGDLQHAVKWVIGQIDLSASPALNSPLALFAGFCFHLLIYLPCVGIAMCHVVDANTCLRSRELNTDIFRQAVGFRQAQAYSDSPCTVSITTDQSQKLSLAVSFQSPRIDELLDTLKANCWISDDLWRTGSFGSFSISTLPIVDKSKQTYSLWTTSDKRVSSKLKP